VRRLDAAFSTADSSAVADAPRRVAASKSGVEPPHSKGASRHFGEGPGKIGLRAHMNTDQYWQAVPIRNASYPSLRPILYLLVTIIAAVIITAFAEPSLSIGNASVLAPTGFICIGVFLWQMRSASLGVLRPVFLLLALHAVVGYWVAASSVPWIVAGTLDDRAFSLSFAVIAAGLMVASFAFHHFAPSRGWLPRVDTEKLVKLAKWMTVGAAVGIFYFYNRNKLLPWQVNILNMADLRYRISGVDEWLINRSVDVLMMTVPLLFLFKGTAKLFSLVGLLGLATTFTRAPILAVIFVIALSNVIRTGKLRRLLLTVGAALAVYSVSQLFYSGLLRGEIPLESAYLSIASGLPEVRDLGWILWLNGPNFHWGSTLIQPVLPIPSFLSPWVLEHGLRSLTTRMIGYDWDEMGGLRITLAGEGYLNFTVIGALGLGALWGCGMRKISNVVKAASESRGVVDAYFAALLVSWMAFWIHLGGSQASGVVRSGVLILALMLYFCRV
jgi:hypothetical protein